MKSLPALLVAVLILPAADVVARQEDAETQRREVVRLVRLLGDQDPDVRDEAEQRLVELGPEILPLLPANDTSGLGAEQRRRLRRVVPQLWKASLLEETKASRVSLPDEPLPLPTVIERVREQTGNGITVRDIGAELPTVRLPLDDVPFWEAIDRLAEAAGVTPYPYGADRTLELVPRPGEKGLVSYGGPGRVEASRITLTRSLGADAETGAHCDVEMELWLEPRLRPLLIEVDTEKVDIRDADGNRLPFENETVYSLGLEENSLAREILLRVAAPPREHAALSAIEGTVDLVLPAHQALIEFPDLKFGEPMQKSTAGLKVQVGSIANDEGFWTVPVAVEFAADVEPIESHLMDAMMPAAYLQTADGQRFDVNGGVSALGDQYEFYFVDAPLPVGDYRLIVRVPQGLTRIPLDFSFRDVRLP